ncbi:unnamed protein product, partial [Ectocarpus sp. 12 AP-2014]
MLARFTFRQERRRLIIRGISVLAAMTILIVGGFDCGYAAYRPRVESGTFPMQQHIPQVVIRPATLWAR